MPKKIKTILGEQIEVRDLRQKRFVTIDKDVLLSMDPFETRVYLVLDYHRNLVREDSFTGFRKATEEARISRSTFIRAIKRLAQKRIIKVEKIEGFTNRYYLLK